MKTFHVVSAAALLFVSTVCSAGAYDAFLLNIYSLERCGFMTTSENARADRVDTCLDVLDATNADLDQVVDDDSARFDSVMSKWQALSELYQAALASPSMFRQPLTADDLRLGRNELVSLLESEMPKPPSPIALAIQMERIATEYVWRAESTMGAGLSATEILDIETMVAEADQQFSALLKANPKDLALQATFAKYEFIRNSLINYNSNTVPYIVDLYTDKITESLGQMVRT